MREQKSQKKITKLKPNNLISIITIIGGFILCVVWKDFLIEKKKSPASAVPSVLQITLAFFSSVFWFPAGLFPVAQGMLACGFLEIKEHLAAKKPRISLRNQTEMRPLLKGR